MATGVPYNFNDANMWQFCEWGEARDFLELLSSITWLTLDVMSHILSLTF